MATNPFTPQGNTVAMAVTTSAHAAIQVPSANTPGSMQYAITNIGPNVAFLAMAAPVNNANGTQSAPTLAAVIPTDGTPANAFCIPVTSPSGKPYVVTGPPNAYFSAIAAATQSATLYITPGEGNG